MRAMADENTDRSQPSIEGSAVVLPYAHVSGAYPRWGRFWILVLASCHMVVFCFIYFGEPGMSSRYQGNALVQNPRSTVAALHCHELRLPVLLAGCTGIVYCVSLVAFPYGSRRTHERRLHAYCLTLAACGALQAACMLWLRAAGPIMLTSSGIGPSTVTFNDTLPECFMLAAVISAPAIVIALLSALQVARARLARGSEH